MSKKQEKKQPENAILLRRVSSDKQYKKGKFNSTKILARKYAKGKGANLQEVKYNLLDSEHDIIGSAFNKDIRQHPVMKGIYEKLANGTYERPLHLFLAVLDRIDRREIKKSLVDILGMLEGGIVIHELTTGFCLDGNDMGLEQIMRLVTALEVSHADSVRRSNRAKTAHKRKRKTILKKDKDVKAQKYRTHSLPKWFTNHKKGEFIKDKLECVKVEYIFDRLAQGYSAQEVVIELNEKGKNDKAWNFKKVKLSRQDKEKGLVYRMWQSADVKNLYGNEALYGCIQFSTKNPKLEAWELIEKEAEQLELDMDEFNKTHKKPSHFIKAKKVENYYPAIISKEIFQKVRKLVASRYKTGGEPYCKSLVHRLCKCGYCSDTDGQLSNGKRGRRFREFTDMYGKKNGKSEEFYYRLCTRSINSKNSCTSSLFREEHLEELLLRYLKEIDVKKVLNPQAGTAVKQLEFDIKELDAKIAEQDEIIKNTTEAITRRISQGKNTETYDDILDNANDEKDILETEQNKHNAKLNEINSDEMLKFSKTKLAKLEKQLESDTAKHQVNQELARIIDYIELYPNGLPKVNCLDVRGHDYGLKENRGSLYGYQYPAFNIVFRNGVRRTIVYKKKNLDNAMCIYREGDEYYIETFGESKESPMVIGSKKFATDKTGVSFDDWVADGVGEDGLTMLNLDDESDEGKAELAQRVLDRYLATILKGW